MIFLAADPSLTTLLPRMLASMVVVIAVMWIAARLLQRRTPGVSASRRSAKKAAPLLQVVARQGLGKGAAVTIVRAGERTFVLGVTDRNVNLLTELENTSEIDLSDESEMEPLRTGALDVTDVASGQAWKGLLTQVRERTVRRS